VLQPRFQRIDPGLQSRCDFPGFSLITRIEFLAAQEQFLKQAKLIQELPGFPEALTFIDFCAFFHDCIFFDLLLSFDFRTEGTKAFRGTRNFIQPWSLSVESHILARSKKIQAEKNAEQ
jgi:hypothetical protein